MLGKTKEIHWEIIGISKENHRKTIDSPFGPIDSGEPIAGTKKPEHPTWPHLGR